MQTGYDGMYTYKHMFIFLAQMHAGANELLDEQ